MSSCQEHKFVNLVSKRKEKYYYRIMSRSHKHKNDPFALLRIILELKGKNTSSI